MNDKNLTLTEAEWTVMECLWEKSPRTGRETVEWLDKRMGWTRSTTLTMLRRLEAKGAVAGDTEGEPKTFRPLIAREDVAVRETENLLERAYKGSLSLLVSSLKSSDVANSLTKTSCIWLGMFTSYICLSTKME